MTAPTLRSGTVIPFRTPHPQAPIRLMDRERIDDRLPPGPCLIGMILVSVAIWWLGIYVTYKVFRLWL